MHRWIWGSQCGSHKSHGEFENEMYEIYIDIGSYFVEISILRNTCWDQIESVDNIFKKLIAGAIASAGLNGVPPLCIVLLKGQIN